MTKEELNSAVSKFRASTQAVQLGKQLFSAGNSTWSTYEITSNLRKALAAAGLELPEGLEVTLDLAQCILAGGAVVDGVQQGMAIGQLATPAQSAVNLVFGALDRLHVIPAHLQWYSKQFQDYTNVSLNACRVISTLGLDIMADIQLILSVVQVTLNVVRNIETHTFAENIAAWLVPGGPLLGYIAIDALVGSQQMANDLAREAAQEMRERILKPQLAYAAERIRRYQFAPTSADPSMDQTKANLFKMIDELGVPNADGRVVLAVGSDEWKAFENFQRGATALFPLQNGGLADVNYPAPTVMAPRTIGSWSLDPSELKKKIETFAPPAPDNPFDLMGDIATMSPAVFATLFRDVAANLPSMTQTIIGVGESVGIFSKKTAEVRLTINDILNASARDVSTSIVWQYVAKEAGSLVGDRFSSNTISAKALSVISMINSTAGGGAGALPIRFDAVSWMVSAGLTPFYLGEGWVFEGGLQARINPIPSGMYVGGVKYDPDFERIRALSQQDEQLFTFGQGLPYQPFTGPRVDVDKVAPAFYVNGLPYWPPAQLKRAKYHDYVVWLEKTMYLLDRLGRIDLLVQIPEALARLQFWGQIALTPKFNADKEPRGLALNEAGSRLSEQGWFNFEDFDSGKIYAKTMAFLQENYQIDLRTYWASMAIVSQMKGSKYLSQNTPELLGAYSGMIEIQNQFDDSLAFFLCRQQNALAKGQIAKYFGVSPDQLARRPESVTGPSQWRTL